MNDELIYRAFKKICQKFTDVPLNNLVQTLGNAYQEVQEETIRQYEPIYVAQYTEENKEYESEVKENLTDEVGDGDLRSITNNDCEVSDAETL